MKRERAEEEEEKKRKQKEEKRNKVGEKEKNGETVEGESGKKRAPVKVSQDIVAYRSVRDSDENFETKRRGSR